MAKGGVWDHLLEEISKGYDGDLIMIDGSWVRVHQHGATAKMEMLHGTFPWRFEDEKIHALVDAPG